MSQVIQSDEETVIRLMHSIRSLQEARFAGNERAGDREAIKNMEHELANIMRRINSTGGGRDE